MDENEVLFECWLREVDLCAQKSGYDAPSYTEDSGGKETWRDMFEDGLSAEEAWKEELSAGWDSGDIESGEDDESYYG